MELQHTLIALLYIKSFAGMEPPEAIFVDKASPTTLPMSFTSRIEDALPDKKHFHATLLFDTKKQTRAAGSAAARQRVAEIHSHQN